MRRTVQAAIVAMAFMTLLIAPWLSAQEPTAPTPEKVFIANAGGDFGVGPSIVNVVEGGAAERAYNEFISGMKTWGRYQLVANPARADWVFEVSVNNQQTCARYTPQAGDTGCLGGKRDGRFWLCPRNDYRIEMVMMDTKTFGTRKRFVEHVKEGNFFTGPDKIFDRAVAAVVTDVKEEVGEVPGKMPVFSNTAPLPPIPPSIGLAQNVFIQNVSPNDAIADRYSGGKTEVSDALSSALLKWGRYKMVADKADADLVLQISFAVETSCTGFEDPQLTLRVLDSRSGILLWTFLEHVNIALLSKNAQKNFDSGIRNLMSQFRGVADTPTWELAVASTVVPMRGPLRPQLVGASPINAAPIPVTLSLTKNVVRSGEKINIHVRLKNSSRQDLNFSYPEGDPLTCIVAVHDENGNPVADTKLGLALKAQHAQLERPPVSYAIHPGEAQTRDCNVNDLYQMSPPGKYSIEVQQLDGRPVHSNVVAVSVVP
ncbi:MAG TPA: hypothetical protein VGK36_12915 [Candidatus Angelobacter sp.]|jgi:hypothetical protein